MSWRVKEQRNNCVWMAKLAPRAFVERRQEAALSHMHRCSTQSSRENTYGAALLLHWRTVCLAVLVDGGNGQQVSVGTDVEGSLDRRSSG